MITSKTTQAPRIAIDWQAYFYRFCEEHGEPENYDGRLLFRDGWQHSATQYHGPEYPPPKDRDKLLVLQNIFWGLRRSKLVMRTQKISQLIKNLEEQQSARLIPLQTKTTYYEEAGPGLNKRITSPPSDLDLTGLNHQLQDLDHSQKEANTNLVAIAALQRKNHVQSERTI